MTGPTHIIGGFTAAAAMAYFNALSVEQPIIYYSAALFGALIPDICHPRSMVGRALPVVSTVLLRTFGHRSFTHSLLFLLGIYWLLNWLPVYSTDITLGLLSGVVSHFILDAMTSQGIRLFYPLKTRVRFPFTTKTGSLLGERFVAFMLIGAMVYFFTFG
ncbi:hypothetical protein E2L07_15740 [Halalkalibacterium halodurans]|uniref:metal-dependent hydrolase n=1 Tax=Halalkalibacterium halodurans TaxID=86665 RepID=UPI00106816E0|nr:metal-dependent hydrolase [Halalkalibacterium halodurans]TES51644.1 hypothetical protein E2L07_15740 [Halalkalibacterium halodurans]